MKVKISKSDPNIELPKYGTKESAGFDIASNKDLVVPAGGVEKIPTGLIIEAPEGYFLLVSARSSLSVKKGLTLANGIGVVDRDYSGPKDEIYIIVHNFTNNSVEVKKGERVAQGIFLPVSQAEWEVLGELRKEDRGGFGSTGGYIDSEKVIS